MKMRVWSAGIAATMVAWAGLAPGASATAGTGVVASAAAEDTLIFRDGRVLKGKVVSQDASSVRFRGKVGGIDFETNYPKADILSINIAPAADTPAPAGSAPAAGAATGATASAAPAEPGNDRAKRVYVMELTGEFGERITQKPIRDAFKDARDNNADIVIVVLDNKWELNSLEERGAEEGEFDSLFRATEMEDLFSDDLRREWTAPPKLVFWVKNAMGGGAFLPLVCQNIYFSSDGRMGGIGGLDRYFGSMSDSVKEKQISLRIGRAEAMALEGGYEPRLVRAMALTDYVMSYSIEGGKPVFHEREPTNPGEFLLTDDGAGDKKDDDRALARAEGNDTLTLNAKLARDVGISRGTVDTLDQLLFELGVAQNNRRVDQRSAQIFDNWERQIDSAKRRLRTLLEEYTEAQGAPGGTFEERTRQRGIRKSRLQEMLAIYRRVGEGIPPQWRGQNGLPQEEDINALIKQIELEQLADRR